MDDEDDEFLEGLYENGHWEWDEKIRALTYVSDLPPNLKEVVIVQKKVPTGTIEFKDDIDLVEQFRYRRRYQRKIKPGEPDVITLQDIKDIVIYTAPASILSPMLITILHLPTTERFLRALILFCAYYLQIADEMVIRIREKETKVRTPYSENIENEYRDNLADLRVLVGKEYSTLLIGGNDLNKFHHMGPQKKRRSLTDKDARFMETFFRLCVQIVWIALGRKAFNQLELEINRLLKSEIFNPVEHTLKTDYVSKMSPEQKNILLGPCVQFNKKLNTKSPIMNEVFCDREIDFRVMGLGVIRYPNLWSSRLVYFLLAIHGEEHTLKDNDVVLGIIGMPRSIFDTMLRPLPTATDDAKSKGSMGSRLSSIGSTKSISSKSTGSVKKSQLATQKLYPDIVLPKKSDKEIQYPAAFPDTKEDPKPVSEFQKRRWLNRLAKMMAPSHASSKATM